MILTHGNSCFLFECDYDEREIPKNAGFVWSGWRWWTDHIEVARRLAEYADPSALKVLQKAAETPPTPILTPDKPTGVLIADIRLRSSDATSSRDIIEVHYQEKDDDLRELVRGVGFKWTDNRCWARTMDQRCGSSHNRMAETAHLLLDAGFRVRVHDDVAREKTISGDFEAEHTRWIGFNARAILPRFLNDKEPRPLFNVSWQRDDDVYEAAKALPGAKYANGSIYVPADSAGAIADFAAKYDFRLTPGAQDTVDKRHVEIINAILVKPRKKRSAPRASAPGKVPATMPAAVEGGVDAALLDN